MRIRFASPLLPLAVIPVIFFAASIVHAQPRIAVDTLNIEGGGGGEAEDFTINIANTGNEELIWTTRLQIISEPGRVGPRRDNAGDIIAQWDGFKAANSFNSPIAWDEDNEWMWFADISNGVAVAYDPNNDLQEALRMRVNPAYYGCWARGLLYFPVWGNSIVNRYNYNGQNVGAIQFPYTVYGIAADNVHGWLFVLSGNDFFIHVFRLGDDGDVGDEIGVIRNHLQYHADDVSYGLEWVEKHPDGQLWMTAPDSGDVYEIAVDTDNWICTGTVQHFSVFPEADRRESSVAHDRHNLWVTGYGPTSLRIYDDGITETYWVSLDPKSGTLEPGENVNMNVHLDAAGLYGGDYVANLHILSNDQDNPDVIIHIVLHVQGAPDIEVKWAAADGWMDGEGAVLDWNRHYGPNLLTGSPYDMQVNVKNVGTDSLFVQDVAVNSEYFIASPDSFGVAAGESQTVTVTMNIPADQSGEYEPTMTFTSNDPDEAVLTIPLHAEITLGVDSDPAKPAIFALLPPAPNPFNSRTSISFTLPSPERAVVSIFDQSGRLVERLADGEFGVGEHRLIWNAEGLPAGIYFCRLEAGVESKIVKLMLIK